MKIAIVGKKADTKNYVRYVTDALAEPVVTLNMGEVTRCDGLLLPGGGDITPAFFGENNQGSGNIDTALDILQFQALELAVRASMPVLGICKGLQVINVGFGGTLIQDLPEASCARHRYEDGDKYHAALIEKGSWLHSLYGESVTVNSAHHQAIKRLGGGLHAVQWCPEDDCIESIAHETLPIIGVQWHPERISETLSGISGRKVLAYFVSLISASAGQC